MQRFNLLDRRLLPPPPDWLTLGALALAAAGVLATAAHAGAESWWLRSLLAQPANAEDDNAAAEDPALQSLSQRVASLTALRQSMHGAGTGIEGAGVLLSSVAAALADDMWLDELDLRADQSLRISGRTLQAASLPRFSARLQQQPALRALPVQGMAIEAVQSESAANTSTNSGAEAPPVLRFVIQGGVSSAPETP